MFLLTLTTDNKLDVYSLCLCFLHLFQFIFIVFYKI